MSALIVALLVIGSTAALAGVATASRKGIHSWVLLAITYGAALAALAMVAS